MFNRSIIFKFSRFYSCFFTITTFNSHSVEITLDPFDRDNKIKDYI